MDERVYSLEELYPGSVNEQGFKPGKFFIIHSHIGSDFDHQINDRYCDGKIFELEGSPGQLRVREMRDLLDSSQHEIVVIPPLSSQGNQAQNIQCELIGN